MTTPLIPPPPPGAPVVFGASHAIVFAIPGRPVSKNRALRFVDGRAYRTPASREYQRLVEWSGLVAMRGCQVLAGPVAVELTCYLGSRRGMPDADGIAKAVLDGLNGVVWVDDGQVCDLRIRRIVERGCEERVEVQVRALDEAAS